MWLSIAAYWWGTISAAIYRRGSEGRTQSTGSNMTISDMHSWISRTTTWVGVVVSAKYVWVQNCSANYVWVRSLYSARLLKPIKTMTCATSDCSSPNYDSTPPTSENTLKEFRRKNRTDKQVIDKIWYEIEFIGGDYNLSRERRLKFESRKICGFGNNFPKL